MRPLFLALLLGALGGVLYWALRAQAARARRDDDLIRAGIIIGHAEARVERSRGGRRGG